MPGLYSVIPTNLVHCQCPLYTEDTVAVQVVLTNSAPKHFNFLAKPLPEGLGECHRWQHVGSTYQIKLN